MCGIDGILWTGAESGDCLATVMRMNAALAHRGPDDEGTFADRGVALGHRRLSIIDLSSAGHQPMTSADGRFTVVYNGEIYNFRDVRNKLDYPFRSHSDTEVLLAAWCAWGAACVEQFVGMFAFAVWDHVERELHLVRDRLGIKPLYYLSDGTHFVFASEIRAILASGLASRRIDGEGLVDYLRYQSVHQPATIVQGIRQLPPGTHLRVKDGRLSLRSYWTLAAAAKPSGISANAAHKEIFDTLQKAVERRLVADVPFGAFLSGGIDSSAIVALMSAVTDRVCTFTVSFAEKEFDETRYAQMVASKFRTDHHEILLSPQNFLELLPESLGCMDHPSGDGPNSYVVSRATKQAGVSMVLSGLGGDELFAGYPIFRQSGRLEKLRWLNRIPRVMRSTAAGIACALRTDTRTAKTAAILGMNRISALSAYPLYRQVFLDNQIRGFIRNPQLPQNAVARLVSALEEDADFARLPLLSQISVAEMTTYMQHVLLRDTDQMSMAQSLEVRVPFLDHELVGLVLGIPDAVKYPHTPKQLLVDSLSGLLPREIVDRPKMGFTLPFAHWMKRELRSFCDGKINALAQRDYFDGQAISQYWKDFVASHAAIPWSRPWLLVVLEHWLEQNEVT